MYTFKILLITLICASLINVTTNAQDVRDPNAVRLLKSIKQDFDAAKSMEVRFKLEMAYPGEEGSAQKGVLKQMGEKYHVETGDFVIISDGKSIWFINKTNNEGQINDVSEDDGFSLFSPIELLKIYERDDHNFAIINEFKEAGKVMTQIEFTPLDKTTDYFKARLTAVKSTGAISDVIFFYRDGSRLTLSIDQIIKNKSIPATAFTFKAADFPDVYMEDLRM